MAQQCLPFDQIVNYTCSTEATYIGREPDGFGGYNYVIKTAQPNEPRFPYDPETGKKLGLLNEPSSENLLTYNKTLATNWSGSTRVNSSDSGIASPIRDSAGNQINWVTLTEAATSVSEYFYDQHVSGLTTGEKYSASVFVKNDTQRDIAIRLSGFDNAPRVVFNTTTEQFTLVGNAEDAFSEKVDGGWRIGFTATASGTSGFFRLQLHEKGSSVTTYTGAGGTVDLAAPQLELLEFASSVILTEVSSAVRGVNLTDAPVNKSDEFTLFVEFYKNKMPESNDIVAAIHNQSASDRAEIVLLTSGGLGALISVGGVTYNILGVTDSEIDKNIKAAIVRRGGINFLYANGAIVGQSISPTPSYTTFGVGNSFTAASRNYGTTYKQTSLSYSGISEAEAIALTTLEP